MGHSYRTRARALVPTTAVILSMIASAGCRNTANESELSDFARTVDLSPLATVAVQDSGRLKSFDSFSRGMLGFVSGPRSIKGQPATFSYLDLMFRPEAYLDEDIIYVKKKQVRQKIAGVLMAEGGVDAQRLDAFQETGLISQALLTRPGIVALLDTMEQDLLRTAKSVDQLHGALRSTDPQLLSFVLRVVPPPQGGPKDEWLSVDRLASGTGAPQDDVHAGMGGAPIEGMPAEMQGKLAAAWQSLGTAWKAQDAAATSRAVTDFASLLGTINPEIYPELQRLSLESWYFRYKNLTWIWVFYLLALVPLLISVIYKWSWARWIGVFLFTASFAGHTAALGIRWYVAQRWPNSNMFEAVTTTAWFCAAGSYILEFLLRKTPLRNLFFLGAAVCSTAAMMAAYYMPLQLNPNIGNMMPVLHDVWLYIHTNVIIFSYGLIAMAAVSAILYLGYRTLGGDPAVAKGGGAGAVVMGSASGGFLKNPEKVTAGKVFDAVTMVLMELSFVLLWAGIVMGAVWADHSWGRPWGWDPKEVFALNTFIVFLLLVHVRFKVRDKGFWTALLAVLGCGVMLFNWIVVNFVITGLHSYA